MTTVKPLAMPPCPVCGQPVQATEFALVIRRDDDGREGICRYAVYCAADGCLWKWTDRMDDDWTPDPVSTEYFRQRVGRMESAL